MNDAPGNGVSLVQLYASRATVWKLYGFEDLAAVYAQAAVQIVSGPLHTDGFPISTDAVALSAGLFPAQILWSCIINQSIHQSRDESVELPMFLSKIMISLAFLSWNSDASLTFSGIMLKRAVRFSDQTTLEVLLAFCEETFPVDSSKDWPAWGLPELLSQYERAFNQQNYAACEVLVEQLSLISAMEATLRKVELLHVRDRMPHNALTLLNDLWETGQNISAHLTYLTEFSIAVKLRILLMKSKSCVRKSFVWLIDRWIYRLGDRLVDRLIGVSVGRLIDWSLWSLILGGIYLRSGCGLEALEAAKLALGLVLKHPNVLWKAKVQLQIAYIWCDLKEFSQAKSSVALSFPTLCGCGYSIDQARVN